MELTDHQFNLSPKQSDVEISEYIKLIGKSKKLPDSMVKKALRLLNEHQVKTYDQWKQLNTEQKKLYPEPIRKSLEHV